MKILFANPPLRNLHFSRSQRSPGVIKSGTMYYPYWLAHAAALVEKHGHEIFLKDCPADNASREDLSKLITNFSPDLVIMDTSTPSINFDLETAAYIKQLHEVKLMLVGTHVTSEWVDCLEKAPEVDFIAIGEYDFTVLELADILERSGDVSKVAGIAFRDKGQLLKTDVRLPIENMDELPWIAPIYKRFLNPNHYLFTIARQPMVMLIGGRGCKAKCFYCVYPQVMHGHNYRTRSLEHLIGEMKWIQDNMPEINEIVFEDDTFTSDARRAKTFASLVKAEGISLPWFANIRTNTDRETLAALKEAGLRECAVGFESGDDLILANMRKGQKVSREYHFMSDCRELGILVHGCFMVGFPGETRETMQKTLDTALTLNPDSAQFYPVMPYPGTGAYQWAKDNSFLTTNNFDEWLDDDGGHRCVLNLPGLSDQDLKAFCEYAFRKYHFRLKYIVIKLLQAVTNPREGIRSINAGFNFIFSLFRGDKQRAVISQISPIDEETWRQKIKTPYGRMEKLANVVKINKDHEIPYDELQNMLRKAESETER